MTDAARRVAVLGVAGLVLGVGVRLLAVTLPAGPAATPGPAAADPAPPPERTDGRPRWRPVWSTPTPDLAAFHVADDGASVAWLDRAGKVRRIDAATGRTLWTTPALPGAKRVIALSGGRVVCWEPLNPSRAELMVLDAATGAVAHRPLSAAVWSVAASANGATLWVGTGDRRLTALPAAGGDGRTATLPGIPDSLAVGGGTVVAGLWMDSGVAAVSGDATLRWTVGEQDPARRWEPVLSRNGKTLLLISGVGAAREDARLARLDLANGTVLWERALPGTERRVAVSADGGRIALSTVIDVRHADGIGHEHKLSVLAASGEPLVRDKGSRFFDPRLVALSATGDRVTVCDGDRGMTTLDARGRTLSRRIVLPVDPETGQPAAFAETRATPDGNGLVVRRGDGTLTFFVSVE